MNNTDKLLQIFTDVFGLKSGEANEYMSQLQMKKWDSIGTIRLISEIEVRFGIEFDLMELPALTTFIKIRTALTQKGIVF